MLLQKIGNWRCFIQAFLKNEVLIELLFKSRWHEIVLNDKNVTFLFPFFISTRLSLENEIVNLKS